MMQWMVQTYEEDCRGHQGGGQQGEGTPHITKYGADVPTGGPLCPISTLFPWLPPLF